jgi:hypothetical protein
MKVLFVLEYYSPHIGGAEVLFKNLCEGLTGKVQRTVTESKYRDECIQDMDKLAMSEGFIKERRPK